MGFLFLIALVIAASFWWRSQTKNKIAALKKQYDARLQGSDKRAALDAGRAYYSALRNDKKLTMYDEQAITNDLAAMAPSPFS